MGATQFCLAGMERQLHANISQVELKSPAYPTPPIKLFKEAIPSFCSSEKISSNNGIHPVLTYAHPPIQRIIVVPTMPVQEGLNYKQVLWYTVS